MTDATTPTPVKPKKSLASQIVDTDDTIPLPEIEPGAKSFDWTLGDTPVTIHRLKTGAALEVVKVLVSYVDKLKDVFGEAAEGETQAAAATRGFTIMQKVAEVLDPDELVWIASRLLGADKDAIDDAPLEDTLAALAGAIELNNVRRIMKSFQVIGRKLGR